MPQSEPMIRTILHNDKPSFTGVLLREGVRLAFRMMDTPTLDLPFPQSEDPKVPNGFIHRRQGLQHSGLELLRQGDYLERREEAYASGVQPSPPRTILHLHGGGYMLGLLDPYRYISLSYLKLTDADLVATLDYRHLPEHVFPAALEDAIDAWRYLMAQGCDPRYVVIAGDSAGANLALGLMLWLRDQGEALPGGAVLMSPWADMSFSGETIYTKRHQDPMFGVPEGKELLPENYKRFQEYLGDHDPYDPYISPVYGDYEGLPPMLIQSGSEEMLLSDSYRIVNACEEASVPVQHSVYEGMFHTFQVIGRPMLEGRQAWKEAAAAIKGLWDGYDEWSD